MASQGYNQLLSQGCRYSRRPRQLVTTRTSCRVYGPSTRVSRPSDGICQIRRLGTWRNSLRITEGKHGPRVLKGAGVNESFILADRYGLRVLGAISALMMLLRLDNESLSSHTARSRFSLARERRKAMLLAVDLIRHQPHRLIQGTDSEPESFRLPEFETISE